MRDQKSVTDMERLQRCRCSKFYPLMKLENHIKVAELVIEHAKRRVELGQDVIILMDSITSSCTRLQYSRT